MTTILIPESIIEETVINAKRAGLDVEIAAYSEAPGAVPRLLDADAVVRSYGGKRFSEIVENGPKVRWLHTFSAGVDHVLTPAVRAKQGLIVTDSGPVFEAAISEFVLAWMLMIARRLPELIDHQRQRRWEGVHQTELCGATVGVIGRGVASRAKAFGMRTLGLRKRNEPVEHVDEVLTGPDGLMRLLAESDYVIVAAALTHETRQLLGRPQIAHMKRDAWVINIARGAMIDEPALTEALRDRRIGGACLDVFAEEPLPHESPLWDMPNVYIAPHNSSGGTDNLRKRAMALIIENMRRFAAGEPLENVVDLAREY